MKRTLGPVGRFAMLLLAAAACGCYGPDHFDCRLRCGPDGACPVGLICQQGFCNGAATLAGACCGESPVGELFVDVHHTDVATGSAMCPLPSITAAVDRVKSAGAQGVTIHVAAGLYDAEHGERFPIGLRGGTSLEGAGTAETIIEGEGTTRHREEGGLFATGNGYDVALLLGDDRLTTRVSHLTIRIPRPHGVPLPASTIAVLCDRGNATPIGTRPPAANTLIDDVILGPGFDSGLAVTNAETSGCNVLLTSSTVSGVYCGVWAIAGSYDLPSIALQIGDGTVGGSNTFSNIYNPYRCGTPEGAGLGCSHTSPGLAYQGNASQVLVLGNRFTDSDGGLYLGEASDQSHVEVAGNLFEGLNTYGVSVFDSLAIDRLDDNTFLGIRQMGAIQITEGSAVRRARRNVVIGNAQGVLISDDYPMRKHRPSMDFGTLGDPGDNVFHCNSGDAPIANAEGYDLLLDGPVMKSTLQFAGNLWDHVPPTTGGEGAANGTDVVDRVTTPHPPVILDGARPASGICPVVRMR